MNCAPSRRAALFVLDRITLFTRSNAAFYPTFALVVFYLHRRNKWQNQSSHSSRGCPLEIFGYLTARASRIWKLDIRLETTQAEFYVSKVYNKHHACTTHSRETIYISPPLFSPPFCGGQKNNLENQKHQSDWVLHVVTSSKRRRG